MKLPALNLVRRYNMVGLRWKSKLEVNMRDIIKGTCRLKGRWSQRLFEPNLIQSTSTGLSTWHNVPNSLNLKIQDSSGGHLGFWKMWMSPDWMMISAPDLVGRCNTAMQRWQHDRKSKMEVNLRDLIKRTFGTKGLQF